MKLALGVVILLLVSIFAGAQTSGGNVSGQVFDALGGSVPDAVVITGASPDRR